MALTPFLVVWIVVFDFSYFNKARLSAILFDFPLGFYVEYLNVSGMLKLFFGVNVIYLSFSSRWWALVNQTN